MSQRLPMLIALLVLPFAASASETKPTDAETQAQPKKPVPCALVTGSRIRPSLASGCEAVKPFRSYSAEELQRTGQIDLMEALRRLDPIFR